MGKGYSKETFGGRTVHYDENGKMNGYSKPGPGGKMINYDANGNIIGSTRTNSASGVKHTFDKNGDHKGTLKKGVNRSWRDI